MCHVEDTVYNAQCAEFSVQNTIFNVQYVVLSVQVQCVAGSLRDEVVNRRQKKFRWLAGRQGLQLSETS